VDNQLSLPSAGFEAMMMFSPINAKGALPGMALIGLEILQGSGRP
jgi:hypothetical protein